MIARRMEIDMRLARQLASSDPTDAQFRLLVESVTDYAIYLLDASGRVMSWNAGAERIKGYAAAEILGRHFSLFYSPEDRAAGQPEQMLERAARDGRVTAQGWRLRQDGSRFWADGVITALRSHGAPPPAYPKATPHPTRRPPQPQPGEHVPEGRRGPLSLRQPPAGRALRLAPRADPRPARSGDLSRPAGGALCTKRCRSAGEARRRGARAARGDDRG